MKHLVSFFLCMCTLFAFAQDNIVQTSLKELVSGNQQRISELANAFSEEQYDWRPAEGVRSVGEVILHTAAANYFLMSKLGYTVPDSVDLANMEKIKGKQQVLDALNQSFVFALEKMGEVKAEEFSKEVDLGFVKMNALSTLMVILEHTGEHKGQLIAYARSNGITPPWSN